MHKIYHRYFCSVWAGGGEGFTTPIYTGYSVKMEVNRDMPPNPVDTKSMWENCFVIRLHFRTLS